MTSFLLASVAGVLGAYAADFGWALAGAGTDPPFVLVWISAYYVAIRVWLDRERQS